MQATKQKTTSPNRAHSNGIDAIELLKEDHRSVAKIFAVLAEYVKQHGKEELAHADSHITV